MSNNETSSPICFIDSGWHKKSLIGKFLLLGSISYDYELFSYFLAGLEEKKAILGNSLTNPRFYSFKEYDLINLHVAFKFGGEYFNKAVIENVEIDKQNECKLYHLRFIETPKLNWPIYLEYKSSNAFNIIYAKEPSTLLISAVREFLYLKKGIYIYVKHLNVFLSRVIGSTHSSYAEFSRFYFNEALEILKLKIEKITLFLSDLEKDSPLTSPLKTIQFLDNEKMVETELNLDILNMAYSEGDHLPYIVAIKDLEEKLYWNLNYLILLAIKQGK